MRERILRDGIFALGLLLFGIPGMLSAQGAAGSLSGRISDPSGAAVPRATVQLTTPTGEARKTLAGDDGTYRFDGLAAGNYALRVEAPGFAPFEIQDLALPAAGRQLDVRLELEITKTEVTVSDTAKVDLDPSSNVSALVLKGEDLETLSDNPDELQAELQALAGPAAGPNAGEIFVDGFSGGRLPPKSAIREIRINRNPFSAEYDHPGFGRIEIFTKPGSDQFHGQAFFNFGDSRFNSRNPFAAEKPPSQMKMANVSLSGPLNQRTSFSLDADRHQMEETSVVNAVALDSGLKVARFSQAVLSPLTRTSISPRLDYQWSASHTLSVRYMENRFHQTNQGIGELTLPERASDALMSDHTLQLTETAVLNAHAINETRLQLIRRTNRQTPHSLAPAVSVLGAFEGGGAPSGASSSAETAWELHNVTSLTRGSHLIKVGGRLRGSLLDERSTQNFNGRFVFPSLEAYRITLVGLENQSHWDKIRAAGGGPSLYSITLGNPLAKVRQVDGALFAQDDWRLRPNFTFSLGLRYEAQSNLQDHADLAPRLGFAWGLGRRSTTVVRGGFGVFYDRVGENLLLQAIRLNGSNQQQYLIRMPDFYPAIPSADWLTEWRLPTAIRRLDPTMQAPYMMQASLGVERQLPHNVFVSVTYAGTRGLHLLRSRNINAPMDGVRPYPGGDIYQYETTGGFRQHQLITNVNARVNRKLSLFGYYALARARSDTEGADSFPADNSNLAAEWSRAGFDVRHRVFWGGSILAPFGLRLNPFLMASSGRPFNITLGKDVNGDSIYNDRPTFATDLTRPSVVVTRWGAFDTDPLPGQVLIPRNWGEGPGQVTLNLRVSRTFGLGGERGGRTARPMGEPAEGAPPPGAMSGPGGGRGPGGFAGGPRGGGIGRLFGEDAGNSRYSLTFAVSARNLLNHVNLAPPIGTLTSPLFGQSNALASGMGPASASANRRLEFQVRFNF